MAYVAIKPCRFAGQSFRIGESVPAEFIQPGAAKNLVKMGIIAEDGGTIAATPIKTTTLPVPEVVIRAADMDLTPTPEGLQAIFDVLTSKVDEAETIINEMTDDDALILLNLADSRKSIKELTQTRAEALAEGTVPAESAEIEEVDQTPGEGEKIAQEGEESEGEL